MIIALKLTFPPNFCATAPDLFYALHPDKAHGSIQVRFQDIKRAC
jgi:hypothetical protein